MGYSSLNNVNSSDMASDLLYSCEQAFMLKLSKGLKEEENCYNTSGWTNIALIIESGALDKFCKYSTSFEKFDWGFLIEKLKKEVENSSESNAKVWDSEENRKMHHDAFKRMLANTEQFLRNIIN
jgi:hypothetical protein